MAREQLRFESGITEGYLGRYGPRDRGFEMGSFNENSLLVTGARLGEVCFQVGIVGKSMGFRNDSEFKSKTNLFAREQSKIFLFVVHDDN